MQGAEITILNRRYNTKCFSLHTYLLCFLFGPRMSVTFKTLPMVDKNRRTIVTKGDFPDKKSFSKRANFKSTCYLEPIVFNMKQILIRYIWLGKACDLFSRFNNTVVCCVGTARTELFNLTIAKISKEFKKDVWVYSETYESKMLLKY